MLYVKSNAIRYFVALIFILTFIGCNKLASSSDNQNCKQQLRSLGALITLYRSEHGGQFPKSLEMLDTNEARLILTCPGHKRSLSQTGNSLIKTDYYLVDWSTLATNSNCGEYPLMYDRSISNHEGLGINLLLINGSVRWDSHAKWLKSFATNNTNVKLLVPE